VVGGRSRPGPSAQAGHDRGGGIDGGRPHHNMHDGEERIRNLESSERSSEPGFQNDKKRKIAKARTAPVRAGPRAQCQKQEGNNPP
jgi:hypothetical protein